MRYCAARLQVAARHFTELASLVPSVVQAWSVRRKESPSGRPPAFPAPSSFATIEDMAITPMMRQYQEAKRACPDALLLFRMGDFYELFHDDAKTAARVLNLALTSREKGEDATPMAGFPYHQLESYLGKLIAAGFRAAVCEQVEDPKLAKAW